MSRIVKNFKNGQKRKELSELGGRAYERLEWVRNTVLPEPWKELREHLRVLVPEAFSYGKAKDEDALCLLYTHIVLPNESKNPRLYEALKVFFRDIYQLGSDLKGGKKDLVIIMDHLID